MATYQKPLANIFTRLGISEDSVRMIMGVIVVLLVALLSYNIFKPRQATEPNRTNTAAPQAGSPAGSLTNPTAAVALPTAHIVTAGENLWSIAEKYYSSGYNWVDIARFNGLVNPGQIIPGQKLVIPKVDVRLTTVSTPLTPVVTAHQISGNSYTVIHGDNLWNIALRAYGDGFSWTRIAAVNHLTNPGLIHAGNVLVIPR